MTRYPRNYSQHRDDLAEGRDAAADERDQATDARDERAEHRDTHADERDLTGREHLEHTIARVQALRAEIATSLWALEDSEVDLDRRHLLEDARTAVNDLATAALAELARSLQQVRISRRERTVAAADRRHSARDRAVAARDRFESANDRNQSAIQRELVPHGGSLITGSPTEPATDISRAVGASRQILADSRELLGRTNGDPSDPPGDPTEA